MNSPDQTTRTTAPKTPAAPVVPVILGILLGALLCLSALIVLIRGEIGDGSSEFVTFLGRFHPLILHLPIGGLAYLILVEFLRLLRRRKTKPARMPALVFTALSAAAAAALGYMLGDSGDYSADSNFLLHFQSGVIFAGAAGLALVFGSLQARWQNPINLLSYYLAVAASFIAMSIAGHAGASLTHGEEYLTAYAPQSIKGTMERAFGVEPRPKGPSAEEIAAIPVEERDIYVHVVNPILDNHCFACHSAEMQKGKLRLDSWDAIMAGGEEGTTVIAGDPLNSPLVARMALPLELEEHMPPKKKPQHDAAALLVLQEWITLGAPASGTLGDLAISEKALAAIGAGVSESAGELVDQGPPQLDAAGVKLRAELQPLVTELGQQLGTSSISFVSRNSTAIQVNGYSIGATLDSETLRALKPVAEHIVELNLSQTSLDDDMLQALPSLPSLELLNVASTALGNSGLALIAERAPALTHLVAYATAVDDGGFSGLNKLSSLEELTLSLSAVTPESAHAWSKQHPGVVVVLDAERIGEVEPEAEPERDQENPSVEKAQADQADPAPPVHSVS